MRYRGGIRGAQRRERPSSRREIGVLLLNTDDTRDNEEVFVDTPANRQGQFHERKRAGQRSGDIVSDSQGGEVVVLLERDGLRCL
jgi:hypothetical protein